MPRPTKPKVAPEPRQIRYPALFYADAEDLHEPGFRHAVPTPSYVGRGKIWSASGRRYKVARWFEVKPGAFRLKQHGGFA